LAENGRIAATFKRKIEKGNGNVRMMSRNGTQDSMENRAVRKKSN
jgi:hypothetical protein